MKKLYLQPVTRIVGIKCKQLLLTSGPSALSVQAPGIRTSHSRSDYDEDDEEELDF